MDFFKGNSKLIGGALIGVLGVASLIYLYRNNGTKETAPFISPLSDKHKLEQHKVQRVQQVRQRILDKINARSESSIWALQGWIAQEIQRHMFNRTSNIELLKHQKCFQSFKVLKGSDLLRKIIQIIKESATSLDILEKDTQQLITQLGLSPAEINAIVEKISDLQNKLQESISNENKELASKYLKAKNIYISQAENKREITNLLTGSGFNWDEGSLEQYPSIVSILIDVHVFDKENGFLQKNFEISLTIEKGSSEGFKGQLEQWSKAIQPFQAIFKGLQKNK